MSYYPWNGVDDWVGSISFTDLVPGTYTLAQTDKYLYNVTSATVNDIEVETTTVDNKTSLILEILSGEETVVVFNNEHMANLGKKTTPGEDSSPLDYGVPGLCAWPVQSTWDPHMDDDNTIDLVMNKPMKIMVNLVPLLSAPYSVAPNTVVDLWVEAAPTDPTGTGFLMNPYHTQRFGADISAVGKGVVVVTPEPNDAPPETGDFTITCTIAIDGTTIDPPSQTFVSVKNTYDLSLYYIPLKAAASYTGYGTLELDAFNYMVDGSSKFIDAVYPVSTVNVMTPLDDGTSFDMASMEGNEAASGWEGMYWDCVDVAAAARAKYPVGTPNVIGVGIAPFTSDDENYFVYHGAVNKRKQYAVGVSWGSNTKGVIALEDYLSSVAHETGHTFDLYVYEPEQYDQIKPGLLTVTMQRRTNGETAMTSWAFVPYTRQMLYGLPQTPLSTKSSAGSSPPTTPRPSLSAA